MTQQAEELANSALKLSREDRAELMDCLAESLDDGPADFNDHPFRDEWLAEIQRRIDDVDSGRAKTVPAEEVFAKARQMTKR